MIESAEKLETLKKIYKNTPLNITFNLNICGEYYTHNDIFTIDELPNDEISLLELFPNDVTKLYNNIINHNINNNNNDNSHKHIYINTILKDNECSKLYFSKKIIPK